MIATVTPSTAYGTVQAPPSKSMAHRYLIGAALSDGKSIVHNIELSQDILATMDCIRALGGSCHEENGSVYVEGIGALLNQKQNRIEGEAGAKSSAELSDAGVTMEAGDVASGKEPGACREYPCRESGSTLRFFMPISMLLAGKKSFIGSEVLVSRPLSVYEQIWEQQGLEFVKSAGCIETQGVLSAGEFEIAGNISSQFITGLLFTLPVLSKDSIIKLIPPVESRSYIELTLRALKAYGVSAKWLDENTLSIPGGQTYKACEITTEGDYSNAAFLDAFSLIGGNVTVGGLDPDSLQGDKVYREYYKMLSEASDVKLQLAMKLFGKDKKSASDNQSSDAPNEYGDLPVMDLKDCPDLGPVLMTLAGLMGGAVFTGTRRLKMKESDRGRVMCEELARFGIDTRQEEDTIIVYPSNIHTPYEMVHGHNDHRIVMSMVLLMSVVGGSVDQAGAVSKSFPSFYEVIRTLGVQVTTDES